MLSWTSCWGLIDEYSSKCKHRCQEDYADTFWMIRLTHLYIISETPKFSSTIISKLATWTWPPSFLGIIFHEIHPHVKSVFIIMYNKFSNKKMTSGMIFSSKTWISHPTTFQSTTSAFNNEKNIQFSSTGLVLKHHANPSFTLSIRHVSLATMLRSK